MKHAPVLILVLLGWFQTSAWAQHDEHRPAAADDSARHAQFENDKFSSATLPNFPMSRDGAGTSWHPDTSPMHAFHTQAGGWSLMFHGGAFLRFTAQDMFESGTRGGHKLDIPNWAMGMAQRPLSERGKLTLRSMISLDPITVGGNGYPLLFQTGETYEGEPLVDRQHPHDFFSELAALYGQSLGDRTGVFAYVGFPGDPALGPPSFMHRPSALHNPDSPLGHHWQDATHILFGVATLGFRYDAFKLDASVFNGKEPDEERFGFDRPRFDSYSARFSMNPNERWALQVSRGFLRRPEVVHPDQDQWRTTASAMYSTPLPGLGPWSTTLLWGLNETIDRSGDDHNETSVYHSLLLESDLQLGKQTVHGRAEWVQKPGDELGLHDELGHERQGIGALTLGTARELFKTNGLALEFGAQGTFYSVPEDIQSVYGQRPISAQVYLRLSPGQMQHHNAASERHEGHH